jgi:hypothetical protein
VGHVEDDGGVLVALSDLESRGHEVNLGVLHGHRAERLESG